MSALGLEVKSKIIPEFSEIEYQDAHSLFKLFSSNFGACFLDSSLKNSEYGRYSFIVSDPLLFIKIISGSKGETEVFVKNCLDYKKIDNNFANYKLIPNPTSNSNSNPFDILRSYLNKFKLDKIDDLPPFQGGACGYFGYEMAKYLEDVPTSSKSLDVPDLAIGFYDWVIAFDHNIKKSWVISSGFCLDIDKSEDFGILVKKERLKALDNINKIKKIISNNLSLVLSAQDKKEKQRSNSFSSNNLIRNFTKESYMQAVEIAKNKILEGDIFEVNISQQFSLSNYKEDPFKLYEKLRDNNPAPFSCFLNFKDYFSDVNSVYILSNSPERFLKLTKDKEVETKPIKGTARRSENNLIDKNIKDKLLNSKKDRAENIMIVDLMRNDLSKVCYPESINVPFLCALESYAGVHHLVSTVTGTLDKNKDAVALLKATFPGGSITGAPKIQAMQVINEIEKKGRGPYCGSMGYLGFDGSMDISIGIRTVIMDDAGNLSVQAGGAITARSDALSEYHESLDKINKILKIIIPQEEII